MRDSIGNIFNNGCYSIDFTALLPIPSLAQKALNSLQFISILLFEDSSEEPLSKKASELLLSHLLFLP